MPSIKFLAASLVLLAQFASSAFAQSTLPPTPAQRIALNPLTNKVYVVDEEGDAVNAFDIAAGTSRSIAVGDGPRFIAVDPVLNRVYVNNSRASSLSVLDGATDTLIATYPIGSSGPIAVNPVTSVAYIVRMTGVGTDEVTYFHGLNNTWYTIATQSFQPTAVAVNPITDKIVVAHYATGDVRIIDGAFNPAVDHPTAISRGMWSKPFAVAANPVTNKYYVITEDSRGPIAVINGANNSVAFLAAGTARVPKAVAVNTVTNKAYAAFSNEVIVVDGTTNAVKSIAVANAGTGAAALGVNTGTNRILLASATGVLTVIDGNSDTVVSTGTVPLGTSGIAINPVTGTTFFDVGPASLARQAGETVQSNPLATSITSFPNNTSSGSGTLTFNVSNGFVPYAMPVRGVYYRVGTTGSWIAATGTGPYSGSFSGLPAGSHTVYAFAVDGQDAPLATGAQSSQLVGAIASYTFTVAASKVVPSVSIASSGNPATAGSSVTFTSSVTGSAGTATGSVTFRDGSTAICPNVALSGGSASCTASLPAGTHQISAAYSGDAKYQAATSGTLNQTFLDPASLPDLAVSQARSPVPASTGKDLVFDYTVSNSGQASASGVVLTNAAPAGSAFVWASAGCGFASGTVTCSLDDIATGAERYVRVVWRPSAQGTLSNTVSVSGSTAEGNTANNSSVVATTVNAAPAATLVLRYRLYNDATKEHLYTTDLNEYNTLGASGAWVQEGTIGRVLDNPGTFNGVAAVPYYRLYDSVTRWHHWTTDPNEYYTLIQYSNWHAEGVDGYILPTQAAGTVALYRLAYPANPGLHHWTTDQNEYNTLITSSGWVGEGGTGFVIQ